MTDRTDTTVTPAAAQRRQGRTPDRPTDTTSGDLTYADDVLDLLDRAGVPTTCPPLLEPRHIEAVLGITRDQRRALEAAGWLARSGATPGGHARYSPADLARAVLRHSLRAYWDRLDPEDPPV